MITTFEDLESFYSDNPARRRSPEASYGVHWRLDGWTGTWRVSYVRDTGEVYAVFQGPTRTVRLPTGETAGPGRKGARSWRSERSPSTRTPAPATSTTGGSNSSSQAGRNAAANPMDWHG